MRGRMGGMTLPNKAALVAALADNYLQIEQMVTRISGRISDDDWRQTLDQIGGLRKVRRQLEAKLKALGE